MLRNMMMDKVAQRFGLEDKRTIEFFILCERGNAAFTQIVARYKELMMKR